MSWKFICPTTMKNNQTKKKLCVFLCLVMAFAYFFLPGVAWPPLSIGIATALMLLFFGKEKIEDERVEHLKMRAILAGFTVGFLVALLLPWLLQRLHRETVAGKYALSAFDLIIVTMVVALGLFHTWRWRDGRVNPPDQG